MTRNSTSIRAGAAGMAGGKRRTQRSSRAIASSKAIAGAEMQGVREESAAILRELIADLCAAGEIKPIADDDISDEVNPDDVISIELDVDIADRDNPSIEEWDTASGERAEQAFALGKASAGDAESASLQVGFELLIETGQCRFNVPDWACCTHRTDRGRRAIEGVAQRFHVLKQLAEWLSRERNRFLLTSDPWDLGCKALEELRMGIAAVSPQYFLVQSSLGFVVSEETFSRNIRDCWLVWPDATAPVDLLFSREARVAWVACAVQQHLDQQGVSLTKQLLAELRSVTKPRGKEATDRIASASFESLSFAEVLIKATILAGVAWSDVSAALTRRYLS